MARPRLLVVGWDGACFEALAPARRAGRMPVLETLIGKGRSWRVRSTTPAVTFPAWTSFLTAAEPSRHGITDFTIPVDGAYALRFANATHRALPTIAARMAAAGMRVGLYGMPATYPPEGKAVFEIPGFDTPFGSSLAQDAVHPPGLAAAIVRDHGRLGVEGLPQGRIRDGWHEEARHRLVADVALRTDIAVDLLRRHELDVFVVHFMESDTVAHHFWQFDDEHSPRHRAGPRGAIADVHAALDASLGRLLAAFGADADVLVLSDHGTAGAGDRVVAWNRLLADLGWLAFRRGRPPLAAAAKRAAMAVVPPALQGRVFAAAGTLAGRAESASRFAGIDWARTRAWSDEAPYFPSVRLNIRGRERSGTVEPSEAGRVLDDLANQLMAVRDPLDGGSVVVAVRRREELPDGPFAHRLPDLVLELRAPGGYAYGAVASRGGAEKQSVRRLRRGEGEGSKGTSTSGVHSTHGMAVLVRRGTVAASAGPHASPDAGPGSGASATVSARAVAGEGECSLADLGATALALVGLAVPAGLDGRSLVGGEVGGEAEPMREDGPVDYDAAAEAAVAERLRALGYLP